MRRPKRPTVDLLLLFVGVFTLQQAGGLVGFGVGWFALAAPLARPWTLVTSVYAHATLHHLLANSVALVVVGLVLERATTRLRLHAFVLATGALSGVAELLSGAVLGRPGAVLGASGAILACVGYLLAGNRLTGGLLSRLELGPRGSAVLLVVAAVAVTVLTAGPGVAVVAHVTGFLLGVAAGRLGVLDTGSGRGGPDRAVRPR
jgi:membrane associated rhomboid family serine protease